MQEARAGRRAVVKACHNKCETLPPVRSAREGGGLSAGTLGLFRRNPTRAGLLVGYAAFDEETIDDAIARLARNLR